MRDKIKKIMKIFPYRKIYKIGKLIIKLYIFSFFLFGIMNVFFDMNFSSKKRNMENLCKFEANSSACITLGDMYRDGKVFDRDYLKALVLYKQACNLKNGEGCYKLGRIFYLLAKENDPMFFYDTLKASKKACKLGNGDGCALVGKYYELIGKKPNLAFKFYKKALKLGEKDGIAHFQISGLYEKGKVVKKDIKKAIKYYQEACNLKSEEACKYLGEIIKDNIFKHKDKIDSKILTTYLKNICYLFINYNQ